MTDRIASNVRAVRERMGKAAERAGRDPSSVTLVAVSKKIPPAAIRQAVESGVRELGENYVQELCEKQAALAFLADLGVSWHYIGRLQKNKAKDVVGRVALLHGVDSSELARIVDKHAQAHGILQDVLVQVNVAGEATKAGIPPADLPGLLETVAPLSGIRCLGLTTIPPPATFPEENRRHFRVLAKLAAQHHLPHLSMGMSDDFEVAIEEGATLVRIGTAIFGPRRS
ncbi:MAG: YggS family pyridoxal phosphate-dependent enzyme [Deltaproteobacteria bacterium]|nr:YggS family pyridoxal phosphate-dependent enzyme [Deltaproteobacteria bacterium]